jgi:hypothetical protein
LGVIDKTTDWVYYYSETPDFELKDFIPSQSTPQGSDVVN